MYVFFSHHVYTAYTCHFVAVLVAIFLAGTAFGQVQFYQDWDSGSLNVAASTVDFINPSNPLVTLQPRYTWINPQWWWVYGGVSGLAGTTPTFRLSTSGNAIPFDNNTRWVYSYDRQNWSFFNNGAIGGGYFQFTANAPLSQGTFYVATGLPCPMSQVDALVSSVKGNTWVQPTLSANTDLVVGQTLGTALGGYVDDLGRNIPAQNLYGFKITDPSATGPKTKIVLMSGNHSGETTGTIALEGLVQFMIGSDPRAAQLRQVAEFYIYPMVDPEGRAQGYYRSTPQNPTINMNRVWDNPTGFTNVTIVENAMKADTAGSCTYFYDFHSQWQPDDTCLLGNVNTYNSAFAKRVTARNPEHNAINDPDSPRYARCWASSPQGLNAVYNGTAEIGMMAGQQVPYYYQQIGEVYALAFWDVLVPEPAALSLFGICGLLCRRRRAA